MRPAGAPLQPHARPETVARRSYHREWRRRNREAYNAYHVRYRAGSAVPADVLAEMARGGRGVAESEEGEIMASDEQDRERISNLMMKYHDRCRVSLRRI